MFHDWKGAQLALLCDYDGTLTPLHPDPSQAHPHEAVRKVLCQLASKARCEVLILSGRSAPSLEAHVGDLPLYLLAEHGAAWRSPDGAWEALPPASNETWYQDASRLMLEMTRYTPGSQVEQKEQGLAWHYRNAPEAFARRQARLLVSHLQAGLSEQPVLIQEGHKIVEVRSLHAHKGNRFADLQQTSPFRQRRWIVLGDDRTDEDMFICTGPDDLAIRVGPSPTTHAHYCLEDQTHVLPFLEALLRTLS